MSPTNDISNIERKLLKKRLIDPSTNCWLYLGGLARGYGHINFNFKPHKVHRIAAMLYLNYDLNSDLCVLHKRICPNRHCFNPEHLYIGTQMDNVNDQFILGTHTSIRESCQTHCLHGHEFTVENTYSYKGRRYCKECMRIRDKNRVR